MSKVTFSLEGNHSSDDIKRFRDWQQKSASDLSAATAQEVDLVWARAVSGYLQSVRPEFAANSVPVRAAFASSLDRMLALEQAKKAQFALELSVTRPDIATAAIANGIVKEGQRPPSLASARLIASHGYGIAQLTGNASASWFTESLPGMHGYFRDWQVSGEAALRLKEVENWGAFSAHFGGLFGNIHQRPLGIDLSAVNPITGDATKLNQPGTLRLFQFRFEVPTANRSIVIPFSLTYSNRTDLIKEEDVRASVGISLRFDSLFPQAN